MVALLCMTSVQDLPCLEPKDLPEENSCTGPRVCTTSTTQPPLQDPQDVTLAYATCNRDPDYSASSKLPTVPNTRDTQMDYAPNTIDEGTYRNPCYGGNLLHLRHDCCMISCFFKYDDL